jgi:hypothetical protein
MHMRLSFDPIILRLPTMSIEEAGLREMKMMEKWQRKNCQDDSRIKLRMAQGWQSVSPRGRGRRRGESERMG